ncbi:hypothetical protein L1N85_08745 [Paenibacillus alkaliterrae]|uniref:hypothetical protein n=1 Tax=Paenibacillus alkaliterrae TaxID=320909 RepID=UPI001F3EED8A|nr:hypothetical protein [Paenibacillus alkaliterrae]MCF2938521.1 hypothetical protein [Paenibacillus alkaliterrae]
MDSIIEKERRKAHAMLLSCLLTILPSLIGLALWLSLRTLVAQILIISGISTWSWDAIQSFAFLSFGLLWLTSVFFFQFKLYKSGIQGQIWNMFTLINAVLVLLLLFTQVVLLLIGGLRFSTAEALIPAHRSVTLTIFTVYDKTTNKERV